MSERREIYRTLARKGNEKNLHKIFGRNKIVEVCQLTGQGITQGEVDDYNAAAAAKRKPIQLEFDFGEEVSHVEK